jgi:Caspase domain
MSEEPRKKALIVAISEYNDKQLAPLEFCKNDGEKMYELLQSLGYEISNNHKLIGYVKSDRMRDAIYDFFDNRKTKADDTLLFYYSGHGIYTTGGNILASSEIDYYSPRKMGFSSYDLTNLIQESNSIRIVEVLDSCYSGAARIGKSGVAQ